MSDTLARVRTVFVDQVGVADGEVVSDATLADDLGFDSIDRVEVTMAIEMAFDIIVPDERMEACRTVGDVVALVDRLTPGRRN